MSLQAGSSEATVVPRCSGCGSEAALVDERLYTALSAPSYGRPNAVRMIMNCDCKQEVDLKANCPSCGEMLQFNRLSDGRVVAMHQHCPARPVPRGL